MLFQCNGYPHLIYYSRDCIIVSYSYMYILCIRSTYIVYNTYCVTYTWNFVSLNIPTLYLIIYNFLGALLIQHKTKFSTKSSVVPTLLLYYNILISRYCNNYSIITNHNLPGNFQSSRPQLLNSIQHNIIDYITVNSI